MKHIIAIVGLIIFLSSCATQRRCDKLYPPETRVKDSVLVRDSIHIKDSIVQKTIIKDSTIYTKAVKDSGEVSANENSTYRFNNGSVSVVIKIKDGKVKWNIDQQATISRFQSIIDSVSRENSIYKAKDSISNKEKETVKVIDNTEKLRWHQKLWLSVKDFFAWVGLFLVIFLGLRFAFIRLVGSLSN